MSSNAVFTIPPSPPTPDTHFLGPGRYNILCDAAPQDRLQLPLGVEMANAGAPPSPESPSLLQHHVHPPFKYPQVEGAASGWELLMLAAKSAEPLNASPTSDQSMVVYSEPVATGRSKKKRVSPSSLSQELGELHIKPKSAGPRRSRISKPQISVTLPQSSVGYSPDVNKPTMSSNPSAKRRTRRSDPNYAPSDSSSSAEMSEPSDTDSERLRKKKRNKSMRKVAKKSGASGGDKEYKCEWVDCGKVFTTSGHLARHLRIHSGAKPYKCLVPECESRFSRQDNMMQHYRTHIVKASGSSCTPFTILPQASHEQSLSPTSPTASGGRRRLSSGSQDVGFSQALYPQISYHHSPPLPATESHSEDGIASHVQLFGEPKRAAAFWSAARAVAKPKSNGNR
ncbi:hypothetical protein BC829DRAFT_447986 [Chytridium lagenaria]|nr:hypothetical protein BC829DRAFT_447986 [Chytridium lagenaria]